MKTLAITGSSGYIGGQIAIRLSPRWRVVALGRRTGCDLGDRAAVARAIDDAAPHAVVHCATFGNLSACERDPAGAHALNVEATAFLARESRRHCAHFVYLSTDYVFDGYRGAYREEDLPAPQTVFGRTKRDAESVVLSDGGSDALVLRTGSVYGRSEAKPSNWDAWALAELRAGRRISAFFDAFSSPTFVGDLTEAVKRALEDFTHGVFHFAGPERMSRYEFVACMAEWLGLPSSRVIPVRRDGVEGGQRPADVSLVSDQILRLLSLSRRTVREALPLCRYVLSVTNSAE